jgi:uroporphyrinogen-III synthase
MLEEAVPGAAHGDINPRPTVLLLRSKSVDYARTFWDAGYRPRFVRLLDFEFVNSDGLYDALKGIGFCTHAEKPNNCPWRYQGLILTSPRAAEAVVRIIQRMGEGGTNAPGDHESAAVDGLNKFALSSMPIFAVGNASSKPLETMGASNVQKGFNTAELLALHMVRGHSRLADGVHDRKNATDAANTAAPYLFLCGDKRKDSLPDIFREHGVQLEELKVYKSCAVDRIHISLGRERIRDVKWAAFFSPSGVDAVLSRPVCFSGFQDPESAQVRSSCGVDTFDWDKIRKIAIGKTTASALKLAAENSSQISARTAWHPWAVADKPTALHLAKALVGAQRNSAEGWMHSVTLEEPPTFSSSRTVGGVENIGRGRSRIGITD